MDYYDYYDGDLPTPWNRADESTWYADFDDCQRHALIKEIDGNYSMVIGTLTELEFSHISESLTDCIAMANRWAMIILNCDAEKIERIKNRLK